jgi:RNA 2',3'-cyclic 3'-phosphodiesterase
VRLFVAVTPPAGVLSDLDAAVAAARAGRGGRRDLRWTGLADWHITLAFLGEVTAPVADRLAPQLERAAQRHPPLSLAFAGAGAFPDPARARVLWCGLDGDRRALAELAASVAAGAGRAGAPPPDAGRPFRPHLTLARSRRAPADVQDLVTALAPYQGPRWRAERVELIESHLGGQPRYTTFGHWPLGGDTLGP